MIGTTRLGRDLRPAKAICPRLNLRPASAEFFAFEFVEKCQSIGLLAALTMTSASLSSRQRLFKMLWGCVSPRWLMASAATARLNDRRSNWRMIEGSALNGMPKCVIQS
jgi:hypothetical protein